MPVTNTQGWTLIPIEYNKIDRPKLNDVWLLLQISRQFRYSKVRKLFPWHFHQRYNDALKPTLPSKDWVVFWYCWRNNSNLALWACVVLFFFFVCLFLSGLKPTSVVSPFYIHLTKKNLSRWPNSRLQDCSKRCHILAVVAYKHSGHLVNSTEKDKEKEGNLEIQTPTTEIEKLKGNYVYSTHITHEHSLRKNQIWRPFKS